MRKATKTTVKTYFALEEERKELNKKLKRYRDRILELGPGVHKLGNLEFEIDVSTYSTKPQPPKKITRKKIKK